MGYSNIIVICEAGWILCGTLVDETENKIYLANAYVVRRWDNGRGIGGLAKEEYKAEYTLDEVGDVEIYKNKVIYTIDCEWSD
ncbi:hypothetical protein IJI69_00495 [Candidatus Saccharibacteria bacterium]|nr:hypothetical protein [Candidatus Saccharibacteria bacterium]MBQ6127168.1 hypothetical protein [Candidatus Saccharibacteria bacterium]